MWVRGDEGKIVRELAKDDCSSRFSMAMIAILHPEGVKFLSPGQRPGIPR
jgi:hypothetical protein